MTSARRGGLDSEASAGQDPQGLQVSELKQLCSEDSLEPPAQTARRRGLCARGPWGGGALGTAGSR